MINYDILVGFSRLNVTPPLGIGISGYFVPRYAEKILDELEINAVAVKKNNKTVLIMSIDNCGIAQEYFIPCRENIEKVTGINKEAIFISATHSHTAPYVRVESKTETDEEKLYSAMVFKKFADAAVLALQDLAPARMGYAVGKAEKIGFLRRFRMKDGSTRTNPGVNNPDILEPIGEVDERVNVLRFNREDGKNIVLVNYGNHPDVVGGNQISADWPGFCRRLVERVEDNTKCIFLNGAQGDVNHVNVRPQGGDLNDLSMGFDDVSRGYGHSHHVGSVLAAAVMQVFDKVNYVPVEDIGFMQKVIPVPSNMPEKKDLKQAHYIEEMHKAGRDEELPYKKMLLTTFVAEAERMIALENGPEAFPMILSSLSIGKVALIGIPGEPFTQIGLQLKKSPKWDLVLPCCLTNGNEGYFPMEDSYDEGGYESRSSFFKRGAAEYIIKEGLTLLSEL